MKRSLLFLVTFCLIAASVAWAQSVGDYRSAVNGGKWSVSSTWEKFDGTNWVVASAAPGKDNNVTIRNGYDVILDASGKNCKNLYIEAGATFKADKPNPTSDQRYVRINGDSAVVSGTFGDPNSPGNNICLENARSGGKIVITGTGTFAPSRFRVNSSVSGDTTIFDIDTKFMYTGSSGSGGVAIYPQTDNNVIIFNAGKTITFVDNANIGVGSSISSASSQSVKFIVNGTMDLSQPNSSFTLLSAAGDTATLIVGSTGSIVIGDRFLTTGATEGVSRVTIDGSITVNGTATFANENSFVDGTGSFILGDGATLNIGVPAGLDPVAGPIRTSTRTFSTAANYVYNGTVAQVTGPDLPATVKDLVINNTAGVTLSGSVACDTLRLTNGDLALNGKTITWEGVTGNGTISETQVLTAPSAVNVGNLGAVITSSADLGSTVIKRGFNSLTIRNKSGINRWYEIEPTTNSDLNATLVFKYEESELNDIDEDSLYLYSSNDVGTTWIERGGILDTVNNQITLTGIGSFSLWTAGEKPPAPEAGHYRSAVNGGEWSESSTWEKFDGESWKSATSTPTKDNNVTIRNGYDVILDASGKNCKNLYIEAGATFKADKSNPTSDQRYVRINGDSAVVSGTFGDPNSPGNNICLENARSGGKIVITGTGTFAPSRFRVNSSVSGDTTIFDIDTKFMYTGSSGSGGVAIYPQTDNNVIIFNAGKTITFVDNANISVGSSISSASSQSVKFIVNGTMDLSQPNSSFTLLSAAGDTATLIVGSTGSIVIGDRFLTTGATEGVSRVTIDGSITVNGTATFANENSFVDGTGSFILGDGATLNIGVPAGLDPVAGPIRTSTRTFSTAANYVYNGTVAQVTGPDLPATVKDLVINNTAGVTLSGLVACDTLRLTNGDLALNGKAITWEGVTGNGTISETQVLTAPSAVNVGNLGAVITSSADLGSTVIKRGFTADSVNSKLSVSRWYMITPATNTGLNATLVFNYDESELNGLSEERLLLYSSADTGKTWVERGGIRDVANNKITLTGIDAFSMWTAGSNIPPLPFTMLKPTEGYEVTNSDIVQDSLIEVKWTKAVDPDGNAVTYKLFIFNVDRNELATSAESADTSVLIDAPNYKDNGNYQAYVLAYDTRENFTSSDTVNFILKMNTPPLPFTMLKPTEGYEVTNSDIVQDSLIEVKWSRAVDPDNEALTYKLFILNTDKDSVVISVETPDTSILIDAPTYKDNGNYQAYVLAYDTWEAFSSSDTVDFTINLTPEGIKGDLVPKVLALHQNYPNPFNPITTIKYDLPEEVHVKLVIYDIMGREIRTLVNERQQAGYKSVIWDARNNHGMQVSSGYYICVMQAGDSRKNHKMVLMK